MKNENGMIALICCGILCLLFALWLLAYVAEHPPRPQMYPSHSIIPVELPIRGW